MIKIDKIELNNFRFFTDNKANNSFMPKGKNLLIYGENGSGKSSIFRALELLAQTKIEKEIFLKSKNIFSKQDPSLIFELDNQEKIIIDIEHLENSYDYIKALAIYRPMLEYKNLLKIHYQTDKTKEEINIYDMLRELFREYPLDNRLLGDIKNPDIYFTTLRDILNSKVLNDINDFLAKFDNNFHVSKFFFDKEFTEDGKVEFIINVKIDFMNNSLDVYNHFLNEARLSALAIAINFAIIRNVSDKLQDSSLKLLILDDLLISLDMSNRLSLIAILKEYFRDFQIFLFTHDKGFFEILKDKMNWKSYEIYVHRDEFGREVPYIKEALDYFQSAKKYFDEYDYPACANYLRKEVERLKKIKERQEQSLYNENEIFKKLKKMLIQFDLTDELKSGEIRGKLIGFEFGKGLQEAIRIIDKIRRSLKEDKK